MRREEVAQASRDARRLACLLPSPRREVWIEVWLSDIAHADEVGLNPRDIVRGAVLVVLTRGPAMWSARPWVRVLVFVCGLLSVVALVPPWISLPAFVLTSVSWLVLAPERTAPDKGATKDLP